MKVIIAKDYEEMSVFSAHFISKRVRKNPKIVLGFATGDTPTGMYRELVKLHKEEKLDFSEATTFNLDEFVGLNPYHPQSYHYYMEKNFFEHINIPHENTHVPDGSAKDLVAAAEKYEQDIKDAGGINIQVLGIGANGHIAFNEPGSSLGSRTRVKKLTEQTRLKMEKFFYSLKDVPEYVTTMGIGTIMEAEFILMLASGEGKSDAVAQCVEGPVSSMCPASILQFHKHVFVVVDKDASKKLKCVYETVEEVTGDPYEEFLYGG